MVVVPLLMVENCCQFVNEHIYGDAEREKKVSRVFYKSCPRYTYTYSFIVNIACKLSTQHAVCQITYCIEWRRLKMCCIWLAWILAAAAAIAEVIVSYALMMWMKINRTSTVNAKHKLYARIRKKKIKRKKTTLWSVARLHI